MARCVEGGEGGGGAFDAEVAVSADEAEGGVAQEGAGEEAGFGEDLEAVADAEDVAAGFTANSWMAGMMGEWAAMAPQRR